MVRKERYSVQIVSQLSNCTRSCSYVMRNKKNIFIAKLHWEMIFIIIRVKIIKDISKKRWIGIHQMRISLHLLTMKTHNFSHFWYIFARLLHFYYSPLYMPCVPTHMSPQLHQWAYFWLLWFHYRRKLIKVLYLNGHFHPACPTPPPAIYMEFQVFATGCFITHGLYGAPRALLWINRPVKYSGLSYKRF